MKTIHSFDEIPKFNTEDEEAEFWATHDLGEELLDLMGSVPEGILPPPRPPTRPIAVHFDDDTLRRLKALAKKKHKGYQALLKEFVSERLSEEERREGLVGN